MFPLLVPLAMAAAGVISAKMGAHARRKDAKASILQRSAESLGAPGSGGAVAGKRAANSIDAQEGSDLTNVFVNTLGQTLADKNNRLQQQPQQAPPPALDPMRKGMREHMPGVEPFSKLGEDYWMRGL